MKAVVTFLLVVFIVGVIFAVVCAAAILGLLALMNEERRKQCGNCVTYDRELGVCWWDTLPRDRRSKGCVHWDRETREEKEEEL